jgi:two-component system phosphate regulon response regulator PhoB
MAADGETALDLIEQQADRIHLAILDIMVPKVDGRELCRRLRNHPILSDIPVIFLTAKDQEQDEIEGLEAGGDAYVTKPASLKLVKTHVDNLLKRRTPQESNWLRYGNVYLDRQAKEVYVDGEYVELTSTEYTILDLFFSNPKRVFSRQDILRHISGEDTYVFDRTVDVHIKNLRLKLGQQGDLIKTYRGMGYGLNRETVAS